MLTCIVCLHTSRGIYIATIIHYHSFSFVHLQSLEDEVNDRIPVFNDEIKKNGNKISTGSRMSSVIDECWHSAIPDIWAVVQYQRFASSQDRIATSTRTDTLAAKDLRLGIVHALRMCEFIYIYERRSDVEEVRDHALERFHNSLLTFGGIRSVLQEESNVNAYYTQLLAWGYSGNTGTYSYAYK